MLLDWFWSCLEKFRRGFDFDAVVLGLIVVSVVVVSVEPRASGVQRPMAEGSLAFKM